MNKFKRVFSESDADLMGTHLANEIGFDNVTLELIRIFCLGVDWAEQAVLEKLAEQEPVAWTSSKIFGHYATHDTKVSSAEWFKENLDVPLYAHPIPCLPNTIDKAACVPESAELLKQAVESLIDAAHPAYLSDNHHQEKLIKARDVAFKALDTHRLNAKGHHIATKNCLEIISKTRAPRRDGYGWDDDHTPSNKVMIQLMAKYHLQMLLGSSFEKVMDFGRDVFNYAVGEYVNGKGEKLGGTNTLTAKPFTPRNAAEMRDFVGMHFGSLRYANPETEEPSDDDWYTLSIHDLLSAFSWAGHYDHEGLSTTSSAATTPEGWQLVPTEPTILMRKAFNDADELWEGGVGDKPDAQYKAMLASAPKYGGK